MKIKINKVTYEVPTGLNQILLRQRIEFDDLYSKEIADNATIINEMPGGVDKELELMVHQVDIACKHLSHYGGIPLEVVQQTNMTKVLQIFDSCFSGLYAQINSEDIQREHFFGDEVWEITSPELTYKSDVTFNEFVVSKQIIKMVHDLGKGSWASVPFLAAVYLRKEGEPFTEELVIDGSPRIELMYDLPMDIAAQIAFFLSTSINLYLKTFQSLEGESPKDQTLQSTLINGDG